MLTMRSSCHSVRPDPTEGRGTGRHFCGGQANWNCRPQRFLSPSIGRYATRHEFDELRLLPRRAAGGSAHRHARLVRPGRRLVSTASQAPSARVPHQCQRGRRAW
jgi:hypothetical protein